MVCWLRVGKRVLLIDEKQRVIKSVDKEEEVNRIVRENKECTQKQIKKFWEKIRKEKLFASLLDEMKEAAMQYNLSKLEEEIKEDTAVIILYNTLESIKKAKNMIGVKIKEFVSLLYPELGREDLNKALHIIEENYLGKNNENKRGNVMKLSIKNLENIEGIYYSLIKTYRELGKNEEEIERKIEELLESRCKNLLYIAKRNIAAKLLAQAGSLKALAEMPSSTIQLLGAEKALFRHLRKGSKPPKHGYIIEHPIVRKSKNKGKAARILAEVISMAARIDYFSGRDERKMLESMLNKKLKNV